MGALLAWLGRLFPYILGFFPIAWRRFVALRFPVRLGIIVALLAAMPLPDWIEELPGRIGGLPASWAYFAGLVQLRFGVSVIFGAFIFRFIWREFSKSV